MLEFTGMFQLNESLGVNHHPESQSSAEPRETQLTLYYTPYIPPSHTYSHRWIVPDIILGIFAHIYILYMSICGEHLHLDDGVFSIFAN